MKNAALQDYWFHGDQNPPLVGSPDGSFWRSYLEKSGGSPTVLTDNGFMVLSLDATVETQAAILYAGDELGFDIDDLQQVDFWLKASSNSLDASIECAFGMCSAINVDPDSIAAGAWFRCYGSNLVLCETDDGTNDNDDIATGQSLTTTVKRFTIDFASGLKTVIPPPSSGGKGAVQFSCASAQGVLVPVARNTRFDLSNYTAGLQPFVMIRKGNAGSAGAALGTLSVQRIRIRHKAP